MERFCYWVLDMEISNNVMEHGACEREQIVHCIGMATSGLLGMADLMERGGDRRSADMVRVLILELDHQVGNLLAQMPT